MQLQRFPLNDLGYYLLLIDIALTPENNEQLELEFEENNYETSLDVSVDY